MAITKLKSRISGLALHDWTSNITDKGEDSFMDRFGKQDVDAFIKSSTTALKGIESTLSTAIPSIDASNFVTGSTFDGNQCPAY